VAGKPAKSSRQSLSYWQDYFGHPTGPLLGLFNCVMSVGALAGLAILPYMLDNFGRKPGLVFGSCFMLLGVALQSAAVNFQMFVAARLILGFGDIIVICTAPLLISEIAPAQDRAVLVTFSGATYHSGAFIAAWVTYGTLKIPSDWSWRAPSLIQGLFTFFMLVVVWWTPESPRYYVSKDRPEEALRILAKFHAAGNEMDEVVQLEFSEITSALALEKVHQKSFAYLDFLRTKGNRHRLVILVTVGLFSQWSGNGLVSYYLNLIMNSIGITDPNQQLLINGALTTYSLVQNIFFSFFIDRWGRRPIILCSTGGMLASYIVWTALSARYDMQAEPGLAKGVLGMIFICKSTGVCSSGAANRADHYVRKIICSTT
jgi:MFS family permease